MMFAVPHVVHGLFHNIAGTTLLATPTSTPAPGGP
jgi:hypothetical protein